MRRYYYIRPGIQFAFTMLYTFLTAVEIMVCGIVFYIFEKSTAHLPLDLRIYWLFSTIFLITILLSAFNFWLGTRISHRVAGPVIQIKRALQQAIKGNYTYRIQMRSTDYLHEIGDKINMLMENLDEQNTRQTVPEANTNDQLK